MDLWGGHSRFDIERPSVIRAVEGSEPPPGYEHGRRYNIAKLWLNGGTFILGYLMATGGGFLAKRQAPLVFVPLVGPWLASEKLAGDEEGSVRGMAGVMGMLLGTGLELAGLAGIVTQIVTAKAVYERRAASGRVLHPAVAVSRTGVTGYVGLAF